MHQGWRRGRHGAQGAAGAELWGFISPCPAQAAEEDEGKPGHLKRQLLLNPGNHVSAEKRAEQMRRLLL